VMPKRDFAISLLCASRPLIEFVLRHRAEMLPNIMFRSHCRAVEILRRRLGTPSAGCGSI
jgi:hypothetical protein